jgi:hypothetical protein
MGNQARGPRTEASSALDDCQHADNASFRMEGDLRRRRKRMRTEGICASLDSRPGLKCPT